MLDPATWSGLMIGELLDRVESRRVPAAFTRLSIGLSGNQATLRWWAEPNTTHQLLRSVGNLNSFEPSGNARPGMGDYLSHQIDITDESAVYFRLDIQE